MSKKFFSVPDCGNYIYDSLTNRIITAYPERKEEDLFFSEREYSEPLCNIDWGLSQSDFIREYHTNLRTLVLQITQDCNFRCSYCAYSGEFSHMLPHKNESISMETARRSIDFLMSHSRADELLTVIFYGGEPLLEFEMLTEIVAYGDSFNRRMQYGVSTNGSLLSSKVARWLSDHPNVFVTVTLNGKNHDMYRLDVEGHGTLTLILNRLNRIQENWPQVWRRQIRFIANFFSYEELHSLRDFFRRDMLRLPVAVTRINLDYASESLKAKFSLDKVREKKRRADTYEAYIAGHDDFLSKLFEKGLDKIHNRGLCDSGMPGLIDSCAPLVWRMFVRTDGTINVCEKVSDKLRLGNVFPGFDDIKILKLYKDMKDFCNRNCKACWAQRLCMFCYQDIIDEDGNILDAFSEETCERNRTGVLEYLKMYIQIMKKSPKHFDFCSRA